MQILQIIELFIDGIQKNNYFFQRSDTSKL
jgi:hypothetical protein